jgi:hypothetical protein
MNKTMSAQPELSTGKKIIANLILKGWGIINGLTALITGQQLKLTHWLWAKKRYTDRDKEFQEKGYAIFQLLDKSNWNELSVLVDQAFREKGQKMESGVDWAVNKSIYLDLDELPEISNRINEIISSDHFISNMNKMTGVEDWRVYSRQIWRNFPEDFSNNKKEINSTFFHVDNGGPKEHRLILNIFMYLTVTDIDHGAFTFYDASTSREINRKHFLDIIKFGNLRKMKLTTKIEQEYKPNVLLTEVGQALIINNQVCLHRAGFCKKEHRDMLQILITTPQN